MARFKFRLATLLRMREVARDERRAQLAQAFRAEELLAAQEQSIGAELAETQQRCRESAAAGAVDVDALLSNRRYEMVLQAQRAQVREQQKLVREEIERRRQAMIEASREVRVLEELRTRQRQRHQNDENRLQIKQLDEVAGQVGRREIDR